MSITIELIGFAAAVLTTSAFVPQVIKTYRSKTARDISLGMFLMLVSGVCCWLVYGFLLESYPIIFANGFTLLLCLLILYFKIKYQ